MPKKQVLPDYETDQMMDDPEMVAERAGRFGIETREARIERDRFQFEADRRRLLEMTQHMEQCHAVLPAAHARQNAVAFADHAVFRHGIARQSADFFEQQVFHAGAPPFQRRAAFST